MWWPYLLSAFIGGVVAIAALIIAVAIASKNGNTMSIHFGSKGIAFYKDIELIESAVRLGGVYVKYRNTGDKHATTACFRVRVLDQNGQLIAESEEAAYTGVAPGEIQENVIASHQLEQDWVHNPDNKIDVVFRYGYVE